MSRLSFRFLTAFWLAFVLIASPSVAQPVQPLDKVAAIVNDDIILYSELQRALSNIRAQYAGRDYQLPPQAVLERQVLERLVLVRLQVARAQGSGIRISDEELNQTIAAIAEQNGMSVDGLIQQLAREGVSATEFRSSIRDEITIQHLRHSFAQSRINISEAEINAALAAQHSGNQADTRYHLAHILVVLPDGATPEQIATGQRKIDGIKALIDQGELDFSAAAVRYSDSPNALEGGDLGWRSVDEIPAAFAAEVGRMHAGQLLGPIHGPSGFQLLKLVEVRQEGGDTGSVTEYHARHILIRVNEADADSAAQAKIQTLRARLAGGADFQEVAREFSEDPSSRDRGGDLGWFPIDAFGMEFGRHIQPLRDGDIGTPFRSGAGWHIVQRLASRQVQVDDENRRAQIREIIGRRKLEEDYNRFLQELRGEAYVSFYIGDQTETGS